jgi:uncharacterized protein (DUF1697 family)
MPSEPDDRLATSTAQARRVGRLAPGKGNPARIRASGTTMTTYVALLRAINLGSHQRVAMSDLRDLLERMGYDDVRSLLQSGNLLFRSEARDGAQLERRLEAEAAKRLGLGTDFFVRSAAEWEAVVAGNPFPAEAKRDPGHLLVMFLKGAPEAKDVERLQAAISGPEVIRARGKDAYIVYPNGVGRSRLTNALLERHLGTRGTGRNWNTVLKLRALAAAP